MMTAEAYLGRSRLFQRLKNGPHEQLIGRYAARGGPRTAPIKVKRRFSLGLPYWASGIDNRRFRGRRSASDSG
jgi:hypothetical protein